MLATPTDNPAQQDARRVWREVGSPDPRESLQVIAEKLGHSGGQVEQTVAQTRWFAWCACGFVSTTRNTEADALGALVHHLKLEMRAWTRSALPLDAYPRAPAPDWERVARRNRHWALKRASDTPEERARLNLPENVRAVG
jgi:hypothetical protein